MQCISSVHNREQGSADDQAIAGYTAPLGHEGKIWWLVEEVYSDQSNN